MSHRFYRIFVALTKNSANGSAFSGKEGMTGHGRKPILLIHHQKSERKE